MNNPIRDLEQKRALLSRRVQSASGKNGQKILAFLPVSHKGKLQKIVIVGGARNRSAKIADGTKDGIYAAFSAAMRAEKRVHETMWG